MSTSEAVINQQKLDHVARQVLFGGRLAALPSSRSLQSKLGTELVFLVGLLSTLAKGS